MSVRHLKIGAGAVVVIRESLWWRLLERTTGHVQIAAGAKLIVIPDDAPTDWAKEVKTHA